MTFATRCKRTLCTTFCDAQLSRTRGIMFKDIREIDEGFGELFLSSHDDVSQYFLVHYVDDATP